MPQHLDTEELVKHLQAGTTGLPEPFIKALKQVEEPSVFLMQATMEQLSELSKATGVLTFWMEEEPVEHLGPLEVIDHGHYVTFLVKGRGVMPAHAHKNLSQTTFYKPFSPGSFIIVQERWVREPGGGDVLLESDLPGREGSWNPAEWLQMKHCKWFLKVESVEAFLRPEQTVKATGLKLRPRWVWQVRYSAIHGPEATLERPGTDSHSLKFGNMKIERIKMENAPSWIQTIGKALGKADETGQPVSFEIIFPPVEGEGQPIVKVIPGNPEAPAEEK